MCLIVYSVCTVCSRDWEGKDKIKSPASAKLHLCVRLPSVHAVRRIIRGIIDATNN